MDSAAYRSIVKQTILKYSQFRPSHGLIRLDPIFDDIHDRYGLMQVGWDHGKRIRGNLIYVILQNGKVSIEYDGIEHGIFDDLVRQGIPAEDIVLAFQPDLAVESPQSRSEYDGIEHRRQA